MVSTPGSRVWAGRSGRLAWVPLLIAAAFANAQPNHYRGCFSSSAEEKVTTCRAALDQGPVEKRLFLELGGALEGLRRYTQAVAVYQEALDAYPGDDEIAARLKVSRSNLSEDEWLRSRSESSSGKAAAGGSGRVKAKLDAIRCRRLSGAAALSACDTALRAFADDPELHKGRGQALASLGRKQEAKLAYQSALRLRPEDAEAARLLGDLHPQTVVAQAAPPAVPPPVPPETRNVGRPSNAGDAGDASRQASGDLVAELKLLRSLRDQGLIEDAEYRRRQTALVDARFQNAGAAGSAASKPESTGPGDIYSGLDFGDYHALVIGNNEYRDLPDLDTAIGDAKEIASLLERDYGFDVQILTNATRYEVLRALGDYRRTLTEGDNLIIFYAGHGVLDERAERGYWLPVDAEQDFKSNWISTADITDALKVVPARHVMVIADSCYSGSLLRDAGGGLPSGDKQKRVIERLLKKRSRTVLTSGGLEPVMDSGGDGHSVFAKALLDILSENPDVISGDRLFTEVRRKVVLNANQTPEYSDVRLAGHDGGDFLFRRLR